MDPDPQRERLGFMDAVLSSFNFLLDFGFRAIRKLTTFVRYESDDVFVNVYHGRRSFELGVEIGRLKESAERHDLHDILAWADAAKAEGFGGHVMFQVSTADGVREFVPKLALLVQKYATPLLKGDSVAFQEINQVTSQRAAEYEKQVKLRHLREKAEIAWRDRNYAQLVTLYGSFRGNLTKSEAVRLAYAEKQLLPKVGSRSRVDARKKT